MTTAFCPVSADRIDHNTVRVTGALTIGLLAAFAATAWTPFAAALLADYTVRAWTGRKSPMQIVARRIARGLGIPVLMKNKAPKLFAARIGFLFALATLALSFTNPATAVLVGLSLLGFNVLDAGFNFCVGCFCYINIVTPIRARLQA